MTAMKSVENSWKRGIDKGKKISTDIMNSIYQSRIKHLKEGDSVATFHLDFILVC